MASNVVVKSDSSFEMNVIFYVSFQNFIMEPHLVLKWGSHLHHELVTIFLKHIHEG